MTPAMEPKHQKKFTENTDKSEKQQNNKVIKIKKNKFIVSII